jgi:hypothetical protein
MDDPGVSDFVTFAAHKLDQFSCQPQSNPRLKKLQT